MAAQTAEEHQVRDAEISVASELREQLAYLRDRERLDHRSWDLDAQLAHAGPHQTLDAELAISVVAAQVPSLDEASWEIATHAGCVVEAQGVQTSVHALGVTVAAPLPGKELVHVVHREVVESETGRRQPAVHERQVVRIGFDREAGKAANIESIEKARAVLVDNAAVIDDNNAPTPPCDPNGAHASPLPGRALSATDSLTGSITEPPRKASAAGGHGSPTPSIRSFRRSRRRRPSTTSNA